MRKEIDKAVETFHRIALGTRKPGNKVVPEGKLASFVAVLTELLLARYKNNWYPSSPNRGSGYRCLRINGQCIDPTIVEGLKRADIELNSLGGTELTIWVDPGVVSVRIGEEGSIGSEVIDEEVFRLSIKSNPPAKRPTVSTSDEDEAYSSRSPSPANSPPPMSMSPPPNSTSSAQNHPPTTSADFSPRTSSPQVSYQPRLQGQRRNTPPRMMGKNVPPMNQPNASQAGISSGHIPLPSSYTQARALYHSQDNNNGSFHEGLYRRDALANAYMARKGIPMHGTGMSMMQGNFVDIPIPAMA